jgi:hypothetical protein
MRTKTGVLSPKSINTSSVAQTSTQIAASSPTRSGLFVFNASAENTLWIAPAITAAANGLGSIAIQPLQGQWFTDQPFTNVMNAVFDAGTNAVTVWEFYE